METLPLFPDGLPLVPIARISSSSLLDKDEETGRAVLQATQTTGFFYLDLSDSDSGQTLLLEAQELLNVSIKTFASLSIEEKLSYQLINGVSMFGYKPAGTVKKTDASARPDATEFFNVAKDHLHSITPKRSYPPSINQATPLLASFSLHAHTLGMQILRTLARHLGLDDEETFADLNIFKKPAGDHVRLTHTPSSLPSTESFPLPSHTDFGSVTLLFNWLGGLQIESPTDPGTWAYVKPLPGHAIINLGDAMVKFTSGTLKSAKHRVVRAPGDQGLCDRYSVVYFVRPHDEALMKPVEAFKRKDDVKVGGKISLDDDQRVYTAGDWMKRRAAQLMSNLK